MELAETDFHHNGQRLKSSVLAAMGVCETKARHLLKNTVSIKPSAFANEYTADGNVFERELLNGFYATLLDRLNTSLGLHLPLDTKQVVFTQEYKQEADYKSNLQKQVWLTVKYFESVKLGEPCIFTQAMMGRKSTYLPDVYECGKPDIIIWDGARWWIGDIKRSDEVITSYGLQVYYYYSLLETLLSGLSISKELAPLGFVVACTQGHIFTRNVGAERRTRALEAIRVETFPWRTLERTYLQRVDRLVAIAKKEDHIQKVQKACVECLFRQVCYTEMLLNREDTEVSLIPLTNSELSWLREHGVVSVERLVSLSEDDPVLMGLNDDLYYRRSLLRMANQVLAHQGFSAWRSKRGWANSYVLFAAMGDEHVWATPTGEPDWLMHSQVTGQVPLVVVAFTESELARARRIMKEYLQAHQLRGVDFVCLSEEIRATVNFPLTSHTLKATAHFLGELVTGKTVKQILREWFAVVGENKLAETEGIVPRLKALKTTWLALLEVEKWYQ
jgi:hypothetical protein